MKDFALINHFFANDNLMHFLVQSCTILYFTILLVNGSTYTHFWLNLKRNCYLRLYRESCKILNCDIFLHHLLVADTATQKGFSIQHELYNNIWTSINIFFTWRKMPSDYMVAIFPSLKFKYLKKSRNQKYICHGSRFNIFCKNELFI